MKNIFLTTSALILISAPAMASCTAYHGEDGKKGHHKGESSIEHFMKKMDGNYDGLISKSEFIESKEKRFEKMDINSDGNIDESEIKNYHKNIKAKRKEMRNKRKEHSEDRDKKPHYND